MEVDAVGPFQLCTQRDAIRLKRTGRSSSGFSSSSVSGVAPLASAAVDSEGVYAAAVLICVRVFWKEGGESMGVWEANAYTHTKYRQVGARTLAPLGPTVLLLLLRCLLVGGQRGQRLAQGLALLVLRPAFVVCVVGVDKLMRVQDQPNNDAHTPTHPHAHIHTNIHTHM